MKKLFYLLVILFLAACGSEKSANISSDTSKDTSSVKITAQSIVSQMEKGKYRDGELLVKFKSGVVKTSSLKLHQTIRASVAKSFKIVPNLELVTLPKGLSVKDAVMQYMSDPNVEYAEPNYIRCASSIPSIPNDTYFGNQWALNNTGKYAGGTDDADIDAPEAWGISTGSPNITIAVLDSGIDYNHQDLVGNIWQNSGETNCLDGLDNDKNDYADDCKGWNFFSNNNDPVVDDGHGTHVAGIIGAVGNNGTGVSGVMWNVKLMALKFIGFHADPAECGGDTHFCGSVADEIKGIQYAVANGAKIINASYGNNEFSAAERDTIVNSPQVLVMAAAGNDGTNNDLTPFYPASYGLPNIISVAATDQDDRRASFSNFGLNSVHVAAPGVYILSTIPQNSYSDKEFNMGTSMAAPHVSGLAGLLYSYYYNYELSQIRSMILRYVDVQPSLSGWIATGGRINAFKALSSLWLPSGFTATPVSFTQISLTWTDRATDENGYEIERSTDGSSYSIIGTTLKDANSFSDSGLKDGTRYFYRIRAFNDIGKSPDQPGNVASATTPLNPPTNLIATVLSSSQVRLTWTDNSQSEEDFKIERKGSDGNFTQIAVVGTDITTYTDSGLGPSTKYWYRIRSFNSVYGNSLYSNEPSVTTLTTTGESPSSGGGGGCSIGARQNAPTALADLAVMLMPLLIMAIMRRRR